MKQRICLNMIVKNEIKDIERCLRSVIPFIDYWVIVDTGSTDGTQALIKQILKDIPGELHERPWKNFGHNRTQALSLVPKDKVDYIFVIDADEELSLPENYNRPLLIYNSYYLTMHYGTIRYQRLSLIRSTLNWCYEGVLHEYLRCDQHFSHHSLDAPSVIVHYDPVEDCKTKYETHTVILEQALQEEPNNARYVFYLAQSYRDCEQYQQAYDVYQRRIEMQGWDEEVWYAYYQCAKLLILLNKDEEEVLCAFLKAYQYKPSRAGEALGYLTQYLNRKQCYKLSILFAKTAADCTPPRTGLFLETRWYEWVCRWEYALSAYYTGDYKTALLIWKDLKHHTQISSHDKIQLERNIQFAYKKLKS